jgi:hypothetical protein
MGIETFEIGKLLTSFSDFFSEARLYSTLVRL